MVKLAQTLPRRCPDFAQTFRCFSEAWLGPLLRIRNVQTPTWSGTQLQTVFKQSEALLRMLGSDKLQLVAAPFCLLIGKLPMFPGGWYA
jgi:hypothetical protein